METEGGMLRSGAQRTAKRGANIIPPDFLCLGLACLTILGHLFGGRGHVETLNMQEKLA